MEAVFYLLNPAKSIYYIYTLPASYVSFIRGFTCWTNKNIDLNLPQFTNCELF